MYNYFPWVNKFSKLIYKFGFLVIKISNFIFFCHNYPIYDAFNYLLLRKDNFTTNITIKINLNSTWSYEGKSYSYHNYYHTYIDLNFNYLFDNYWNILRSKLKICIFSYSVQFFPTNILFQFRILYLNLHLNSKYMSS